MTLPSLPDTSFRAPGGREESQRFASLALFRTDSRNDAIEIGYIRVPSNDFDRAWLEPYNARERDNIEVAIIPQIQLLEGARRNPRKVDPVYTAVGRGSGVGVM